MIPNYKGEIITKTEAGYEKAIMGTLFNKRPLTQMPCMMVLPKTVEEVAAVVRYAAKVGKKISICSGGHSWSANHIKEGSILINLLHFNKYQINHETMTAWAEPAVGGSTLLCKLYEHNLFFPAGHCKGVCIGGYLLQGGFAWNGRKLGLACESVLGLDIITANGEMIHASPIQNADMYWAARGAGGGFFGVILRFHLQLYPLPPYRGIMLQVFRLKHLEHVFNWAYEVGPHIPNSVEFQMLTSRSVLSLPIAGIEAAAPVFAYSKDEFSEALAFMHNSPVKHKAFFSTPCFNPGINMLYRFAMTHYPYNHHWDVDNMWTHALIKELLPHLQHIAKTLPPAPSHMLWLNWYPPQNRQNMAFSVEDNIYIALYGSWKNAKDTPAYGNWATNCMKNMAHLSTGIQLADENLHKRPARFLSDTNMQQLDAIRAQRDTLGIFNEWHNRPLL